MVEVSPASGDRRGWAAPSRRCPRATPSERGRGSMTNNEDPGDVTSLETVFESRHFGHTPETTGAGCGSAMRPAGVAAGVGEDTIFRMEFGEAPRDVPMRSASGTGGNAPGSPSRHTFPGSCRHVVDDGASSSRPFPPAGPGPPARQSPGAPSPTPPKRDSNTYRVIAAASCVAALVIAGLTSLAGEQHRPSSVSAQGHRGGRSQGGGGNRPTLGAPSTETQALGGADNRGTARRRTPFLGGAGLVHIRCARCACRARIRQRRRDV